MSSWLTMTALYPYNLQRHNWTFFLTNISNFDGFLTTFSASCPILLQLSKLFSISPSFHQYLAVFSNSAISLQSCGSKCLQISLLFNQSKWSKMVTLVYYPEVLMVVYPEENREDSPTLASVDNKPGTDM